MAAGDMFTACIREQMDRKGFGKKKADEVIERFNGLTEQYRQQGMVDPELHAMTRAYNELNMKLAEADKRKRAQLLKMLEDRDWIQAAPLTPYNKRSDARFGVNPGTKVKTLISQNQMVGGLSYQTLETVAFKQLNTFGEDVLDKLGKGKFGVQRGKALFSNILKEIFGENTGDISARMVATAWRKIHEGWVDLMNASGASIRKLADFHLPQNMSIVKLVDAKFPNFLQNMGVRDGWLNWDKMFWPDGSPIPEADRKNVLLEVYKTKTTDGANKIEPGALHGHGAAIGNQLDQHRFLVFKDAASWEAMHAAYGEGNLFDVLVGHMKTMSHQLALVRQNGPNPQHGYEVRRALARKQAADMDSAEIEAGTQSGITWTQLTEDTLRTADTMAQQMFRQNPMRTESTLGHMVTSTSELLSASLLKGVGVWSLFGDPINAGMVSSLNKMGFLSPIKHMFGSIIADKNGKQIARRYGLGFDEEASSHYAAARYADFNTYGSAWSKRISDFAMRGYGVSGWTNRARWGVQKDFMGKMYDERNTSFDALPFRRVLERAGITAKDWDIMRALPPDEPKPGVFYQAPIKVFENANLHGFEKQRLYELFQGMIIQESRNMIVEGNLETSVALRAGLRPDTLPGAVIHSFSMYKSFPLGMFQGMGRLALQSERSGAGRAVWVASLIAANTASAMLALQLMEYLKGRDPMDWTAPRFWTKALLASGGMGIWGDYLFGVVEDDQRLMEKLPGPVIGAWAEAVNAAASGVYDGSAWALGADVPSWGGARKIGAFAQHYTPQSIYSNLIMQRLVWDRWAEMADPGGVYQKRKARAKRQKETYGNESFWNEGDRIPERAPVPFGAP